MPKYCTVTYNKLLNSRFFLPLFLCLFLGNIAKAQCPPNIDFEEGTFNGWQLFSGSFQGSPPVIILNPTSPIPGRHDMMNNPPGNGKDKYGNFPKNCPNGSGHSIKIGNEVTGTFADKASYTFTIPAGQNTFNLIYNYAIVLNDPNHPANQQPRILIEVKNITDGTPLPCPMDPIVATGTTMPGFFDSPVPAPNGSLVRCKDWAAASINLDNNAGKTIEISFTVTGCGLGGGTHFGYAYIDVNSECSSSFIGAEFCPDDAFINVTAPFGYDKYTWYSDAALTTVIGNTQTINFTPPPPTGTQIYVKMLPFPGFGCATLLTADLKSTLTVVADAGPDKLLCNGATAQLGVIPKPGLVYSWSPTTGLSDPNISNPIANPPTSTHYTLTVKHDGGGCLTTDEVDVTVNSIDNTLNLIGSDAFCEGHGSATLEVKPTDNIQWYKDGSPIPGATGTQYVVTQTGTYYAALGTTAGCSLNTASRLITINPMPLPGFTPDNTTVCFYNHMFTFTNTSTISAGTMTYFWDFDDGNTDNTRDVTHSYALPGTYHVKMVVTSNNGCKDSTIIPVTVNPSPDRSITLTGSSVFCDRTTESAVLDVQPATNIQWYMDGGSIAGANATQYTATQVGYHLYHAVLSTGIGCSVTTDDIPVTINARPVADFTPNSITQCFDGNKFDLTNNSTINAGTMTYYWTFGDGNSDVTASPSHSYTAAGPYDIKLLVTGDSGCKDSLTVSVQVNPTPDNAIVLTGDDVICEGNNRHAELSVQPADNIQWYRNGVAIPGATGTNYTVTQTGDYYAVLTTNLLCSATTATKTITFNPTPKAGFSVNNPRQCDTNNQFVFTDNSTITSGTLNYYWTFGDGGTSVDASPTYSYRQGGVYHVKQMVTSDKGCVDSAEFDIIIYVSPIPEFNVKANCVDLKLQLTNKTVNNTNTLINYMWDFGNGYTSTLRDPVYAYPAPGTYTIKLEVSTALCQVLLNKVEHTVVIDAPLPGITYPDINAIFNYREQLQARLIGSSYTWTPARGLSNPRSPAPMFQGIDPQLYTIEIKTDKGCVTVDTQYVKTRKRIEIYVPNAFTPGNDNKNDYLRPAMMGFKQLNYFKIYDRWGKLLFETKSDMPGWDGRVKGQFAELQTVIWMVEGVDVDGNIVKKQGTTILLH
jgi:gliding motility-associated-like protein